MRPHRAGLTLLSSLCSIVMMTVAPAITAAPAGPPVTVLVTASIDDSGARVTLTFSRRVEYRLEESRSKLRLILTEPVDDTSMVAQDFDSDVLRKIRFDQTSRGTDVIFHLGRAFSTFSSIESGAPFQVKLQFQAEGASAAPQPGKDALETESTPAAEGSPGSAGDVQAVPTTRVVMIDPGHGGTEEGAVSSSGLKEKDLVLDIARRLRTRLQSLGFGVSLTRDEDQSVGLTDRTALANHAAAALFVSIHANSSMRPAAHGPETYFLSADAIGAAGDTGASAAGVPGIPTLSATDEAAMSVARQENLAEAGSAGSASRSEIKAVLWDMAQAGYLAASSRLAGVIQSQLNALGGIKDRGVKQAPFRVLVGASMPAVLVEVGFLSNDEEEKKLATGEYRDQIAEALAASVQEFTRAREREEGVSR
jgi:N-acetylmuramoyl-L-alanine amidase